MADGNQRPVLTTQFQQLLDIIWTHSILCSMKFTVRGCVGAWVRSNHGKWDQRSLPVIDVSGRADQQRSKQNVCFAGCGVCGRKGFIENLP